MLFDNDGTLVDTHALIMESFQYATRQLLGRAVSEDEVMATGGRPLADQMLMLCEDEELAVELTRVYRDYNHAIHDERIALFAGVADGLARLHAAGLHMGVVTSKMHWLAWHGLELTGVSRYLSCCIGVDDCDRHKPDPEPLLLGAAELGVEAGECAYAGDSPFDVRAANSAGMLSAAALWGMFEADDVRAEQPDYACESFAELVECLLAIR